MYADEMTFFSVFLCMMQKHLFPAKAGVPALLLRIERFEDQDP